MKKNQQFTRLLLILVAVMIFHSPVFASDITMGGQLNASVTGFYDSQLGTGYLPQANLDLELFFPRWGNNEIRCAGNLYTDIAGGKVDFFWKRLYWKHRFDDFHLTIGIQPISWSFGSLLNPVDYSLGAVALEEDYSAKFQNAVEIYYPVNWHTSLSLVASSPGSLPDTKIGLRGRTLINDFDVTIHFVQEQVLAEKPGQQRFGITAKGDIGKYGVYGALGYYRDEKNSFSLLIGADYSYFFQAGNRLYLQAEYLNIPPNLLSQITGSLLTGQPNSQDKNIHLFAGNATYQIDDFSSISLTSLCNISDGSYLFMPGYTNQLSNSTTFNIQTGVAINAKNEAESSSLLSVFSKPSKAFIELGISYAF